MAQAKHYIAYDGADDRQRRRAGAARDLPGAVRGRGGRGRVLDHVLLQPRQWRRMPAAIATTLTELLRGELHFEGFVTSDWGANARLDLHQ